jgi:hypothetical protein
VLVTQSQRSQCLSSTSWAIQRITHDGAHWQSTIVIDGIAHDVAH